MQQQLLAWLPDYRINTLAQAKFRHPLLPDEGFVITLIQSSAKNIKFSCTRETETLATGSIIIQAKQGAEDE